MKNIPIYRLNAVLIMIILTTVILYFGREFLIPLFFSIMFAMLLLPVCRKLERLGMGRIWSTLSGILVILLIVAGVFAIIGAQAANLSEDIPKIQEKGLRLINLSQAWIEKQLDVTPKEQIEYMQKGVKQISESSSSFFTSLLSQAFGLLTAFVLILLYFFFLMWKREKYREFFLMLVKEENRRETRRELAEVTKVASQYLIGRMISMAFLAVFYIIGFSIVGLENGFLVALVAVLPTIIPYVGAFVGSFFPLMMALVSDSSGILLPIIIILVVAQIIDNNIIEPIVEGHSMDLSPIFTIIALVLGELVWGIAGMILFIPLFAIIKIICDHIPALHPYAFLLTNEMDEPKWVNKIKGWFGKA